MKKYVEKLKASPEGTEAIMAIGDITVPEDFLKTQPNPYKTQQVIDYFHFTGMLDEPIMIKKETRILVDGYRRYLVAKQFNLAEVPVCYQKSSHEF